MCPIGPIGVDSPEVGTSPAALQHHEPRFEDEDDDEYEDDSSSLPTLRCQNTAIRSANLLHRGR